MIKIKLFLLINKKVIIFTLGIFFSLKMIGQKSSQIFDEDKKGFISVSITQNFDPKSNSDIIAALKKNLTDQLKLDLALKIFSKVNVSSNITSSQTNEIINNGSVKKTLNTSTFKTDFKSNSNITSSLLLQNPSVDYKFDERKKLVTAIMSIAIQDMVNQNFNLIKTKVYKLLGTIEAINKSNNLTTRVIQNKYNEIKNENDEIKNLLEVISVYSDNLLQSDESLITNINKIERVENELLTQIETYLFQEQLKTIIDLKNQENFNQALDKLQKLMFDYPENQTLIETKKSILEDIENYYSTALLSINYIDRINAIEQMELLDNFFTTKYAIQKKLFENNAFDQNKKKVKVAIDNKDYKQADLFLNQIEKYKSIDEKTFKSLKNQIENGLFKEEINYVDIEINKKNYNQATIFLNRAEKYTNTTNNKEEFDDRKNTIAN
jgi:antitoxin component HigA of HigAB toxin-antitoxin module